MTTPTAGTTSPSPRRRPTRQQSAVIEQLGATEDFTSAQDLHARLRQEGARVGLATVYRTLTALAAAGEIDTLRTDDGEAVYRMCSAGHHHHLVCRECGRTVEIAGPTVERWADRVAEEHGFTQVEHTLEVFGRCPACTRA